jgi:hypothetical protein
MQYALNDLTGKSFRIIMHNGKDGILQSNLWKELDITSRDGSRLALKLEKQSLIKREKILEKGRWTYKLFPMELPVDTETIDKVPCLMCPGEQICCVDGSYSPNNCNLLQDWLLSSIDSLSQQHDDADPQQDEQLSELAARQAKKSAKSSPKRATKNNKR